MRDELEREVSALRSMLSSLSSVCRTLIQELPDGEAKKLAEESLDFGLKHWHEWRTKRFNREIEDAEFIIRKAFGIGLENERFWPIVEYHADLEKQERSNADTHHLPSIDEPK